MQTYFIERLVTGITFGVLGYIFVNLFYPYNYSAIVVVAAILVGAGFGCLGYRCSDIFVLSPAEKQSLMMLRLVAVAWFVAISFALTMFLPTPGEIGSQRHLHFKIAYLLLLPFSVWLAYTKAYKLLLFASRHRFVRSYPYLRERIITASLFGGMALILIIFLSKTHDLLDLFGCVLALNLGFAYGWRLLLLPDKSKLLAVKMSFIAGSFVFAIMTFVSGLPIVVSNLVLGAHEVVFLNPVLDPFIKFISWFSFIMLMGGWFVCLVSVLFGSLFYLLRKQFIETGQAE